MTRKFLSGVSLIMLLALAACGPQSAPELDVTDIQNTALAVALTSLVMTQAALPTNTIVPTMTVPPTPIPVTAVPTLVTLPTNALQTPLAGQPNNANASPTPDCYQPPAEELLGTTVNIRFINESDGPVNLSMGMYDPNDRGECFTFAFFIGNRTSEDVTVLEGCYWIGGYQNGPNPSTPRNDYICLDNTSGREPIYITNNTIGFGQ